MRMVPLSCVALSALLWAGPGRAADGACAWRSARWGMTVDEVAAALPGQVVRTPPAEVERGAAPLRLARCEIAGTAFQLEFFFYRASRLTQVTLRPASPGDAGAALFERLAKLLTEEIGQPKTVIRDQALLGDLRTSQLGWEAAEARVGLTYMHGAGEPYLSLVYQAPPPDGGAKK